MTRSLKIFALFYLLCGLVTWGWDIDTELGHFDEHSGKRQFAAVMVDHAIPCFLLWPGIVYVQAGLRMGWIPRSAEIGH